MPPRTMYCEEDFTGQHLSALQDAWERFVGVASVGRLAEASVVNDATAREELTHDLEWTRQYDIEINPGAMEDLRGLSFEARDEVIKAIKSLAEGSFEDAKRLKPPSEWPARHQR